LKKRISIILMVLSILISRPEIRINASIDKTDLGKAGFQKKKSPESRDKACLVSTIWHFIIKYVTEIMHRYLFMNWYYASSIQRAISLIS